MKLTLSLLLTFSTLSVVAQTPQETGRGNIYDSTRGGLLPGLRRQDPIDYSRANTENLRLQNDAASSRDGSSVMFARCTPIQPGSSNVVANPCPAGTDEWGRPIASSCSVNYTGISEITYNPQLNLQGLIIKGNHSAPSGATRTDFEVLDTDGFLTMSALHSAWQSQRLLPVPTNANPTPTVNLPLTDINMLKAAAEMGKSYHDTLLARLEVDRPSNYNDVKRLLLKKRDFNIELLRMLTVWTPIRNRIPVRELREKLSANLEDLAPGAEQTMMAQYLDRNSGDRPQVLCNPGNASQMIGQVVCAFNYETNMKRDPNFCAAGIRFDSLGLTSVCQRVGGVDKDCRASIGSDLPNGAPVPSVPGAAPAAGSR